MKFISLCARMRPCVNACVRACVCLCAVYTPRHNVVVCFCFAGRRCGGCGVFTHTHSTQTIRWGIYLTWEMSFPLTHARKHARTRADRRSNQQRRICVERACTCDRSALIACAGGQRARHKTPVAFIYTRTPLLVIYALLSPVAKRRIHAFFRR